MSSTTSKSAFPVIALRTITRKYLLPGLLLLAIASCTSRPTGPATSPPVSMTAASTPTSAITAQAQPLLTPTATPWDMLCHSDQQICLVWYSGLTNSVLDLSEDAVWRLMQRFEQQGFIAVPAPGKIWLDWSVLYPAAARGVVSTLIKENHRLDIIGPLDWNTANLFHGEWLDLKPLMAAHPESVVDIDPALLALLDGPEGLTGLPSAAYPSAIFYNTALFDKAGLAYPPSEYGPNLGPATYQLDGRQMPWDWDTIREVARRLTLDANGRNATQAGFDRAHIIQYGFSWNYETQPSQIGSFWAGGSYLAVNGRDAQIPGGWKEAWEWTHAGMWGDQPWIPTGPAAASNDFNHSGTVAMTPQPLWLICCLGNLKTWDAGVLPAYQGNVMGRMDIEFFAIAKQTRHPDEAFQLLAHLLRVDELVIGSQDIPGADRYGLPTRARDRSRWLEVKQAQFPWVRHWNVFVAGLNFPDVPNAEAYMPNYSDAWARSQTFYDLLANTDHLDLDKEIATFQADLQAIFDQAR